VADTSIRFHDKFLPDQPQHSDQFQGSREEYWSALYDTICRSSGIVDPYREFDLATSDMFTVEEMASNPIPLRFIHLLLQLSGARRVLEIGAFIGLSAMSFARALPPDGKVVSIEKFDKFAAVARENFRRNGLADKIDLRVGDANEVIGTLPKNQLFDFVFIDGDKGRYLDYFRMTDPLVAPGGLVIVDDVFFHGEAINPRPKTDKGQGVKRFLDAMSELKGYLRVALPLSNGMMLLRKDKPVQK